MRDRFTNELGAAYDYGYDDAGRLETETDPNSKTTTYGYDAAGRLSTVKQPVTGATCAGTKVGCVTYSYDDAGRPTGVDYSSASTPDVTGIAYDALGRRTEATASGVTEEWTWNKRSQLLSSKDANGRTTGYGWDATGNMTSIRYPDQSVDVIRDFDDAGRLEAVTDWESRTVTFDYDADSNWIATTFPGASGTANTDQYTYDSAGRMTSVTWRQGGPSGTILGSETYTRPTSTKGMIEDTTPTGTAGATAKTNSYDARDRLTGAGTETFAYDAASNLTETSDGRLQVFDPAQQLCWSSPTATSGTCSTPAVDATVADFDCDGHDDIFWYQSGSTADNDQIWFWDSRTGGGAYTTKTFSQTGSFTPYAGDFDGDRCGDIFWYDSSGTLDPVWWGDSTIANTGTSFTVTTENVSGAYTPTIGDFDGNGHDDIMWYNPGAALEYLWSYSTSRVVTDAVFNVTGPFIPTAGDYDGDGKDDMLWYADSGADWIWWGDTTTAGLGTDSRTSTIGPGYTPATGDFDGDGRTDLILYNPTDTGDTTWWGTATRADWGNDPTTINPTIGSTYRYDTGGLRAGKNANTKTYEFTWSQGAGLPLLLEQRTAAGTSSVIYGPSGLAIEEISPDGQARWVHHDQLGSSRLGTSVDAGVVSTAVRFDAYGSEAQMSGAGARLILAYAGEYLDTETRLIYLRARYLDSRSGQFVTVDPLVSATHSAYTYVFGSPTAMTDPSGECCHIPLTDACIDLNDDDCQSPSDEVCVNHGSQDGCETLRESEGGTYEGIRRGAQMWADDVAVVSGAIAGVCATLGQPGCALAAGGAAVGAQAVHTAATCSEILWDKYCRRSATTLAFTAGTFGIGQRLPLWTKANDPFNAFGLYCLTWAFGLESTLIPFSNEDIFGTTERPR